MQIIAVGSKNPVKIQSALAGFQAVFAGREFAATGFSVPSGVSDQPMTHEETLQGARARMQALKTVSPSADFYVGIEGGIETIESTFFASAWICISDASGKTGMGKSGLFPLPPEIKRLVESGLELGLANDRVFSEHNSKHSGGAVGSLTNGVITRQSLYEHAMALALIPFFQTDLF